MSLSGKLEDVALADVMQFIHLGRRTGTLSLDQGGETAQVTFHRGAIVGARGPSSRRLGELLVTQGLLRPEELVAALRTQREEMTHQSLGQVLLSTGRIDLDTVRRVVRAQIEQTVYDLVGWEHGAFSFDLKTLRPVDDIAVFPGDLIPDIDLDTQLVLLEAARIFDERNRKDDLRGHAVRDTALEEAEALFAEDGPIAEDEVASLLEDEDREDGPPSVSLPTSPAVHLLVDPADERLVSLADRLETAGLATLSVDPEKAGRDGREGSPPILVVTLGSDRVDLEDLGRLCRSRPGVPVVAILDDVRFTARAYEAGAVAVVPSDVDAICGCVLRVSRFRTPDIGGAALPSPNAFARLRRVVADLRSGVFSASVALNLMNIIAESVERAVLFIVKREHLATLGAFGFGADALPLAAALRTLRIPLGSAGVFDEAIERGRALSVPFESAGLPPPFVEILGAPAADQVVLFPVAGSERVIMVIYTDNGAVDQPIEEIDILDLAAAEVGIAFENELLRRQLYAKGE